MDSHEKLADLVFEKIVLAIVIAIVLLVAKFFINGILSNYADATQKQKLIANRAIIHQEVIYESALGFLLAAETWTTEETSIGTYLESIRGSLHAISKASIAIQVAYGSSENDEVKKQGTILKGLLGELLSRFADAPGKSEDELKDGMDSDFRFVQAKLMEVDKAFLKIAEVERSKYFPSLFMGLGFVQWVLIALCAVLFGILLRFSIVSGSLFSKRDGVDT